MNLKVFVPLFVIALYAIGTANSQEGEQQQDPCVIRKLKLI